MAFIAVIPLRIFVKIQPTELPRRACSGPACHLRIRISVAGLDLLRAVLPRILQRQPWHSCTLRFS